MKTTDLINYKKYLISVKKDEIAAWTKIIYDYKIDIADVVLAGSIQRADKYVKFIKSHLTDIENLEVEIAKLRIEIDTLEKIKKGAENE